VIRSDGSLYAYSYGHELSQLFLTTLPDSSSGGPRLMSRPARQRRLTQQSCGRSESTSALRMSLAACNFYERSGQEQ
jgi:hypothetical protein